MPPPRGRLRSWRTSTLLRCWSLSSITHDLSISWSFATPVVIVQNSENKQRLDFGQRCPWKSCFLLCRPSASQPAAICVTLSRASSPCSPVPTMSVQRVSQIAFSAGLPEEGQSWDSLACEGVTSYRRGQMLGTFHITSSETRSLSLINSLSDKLCVPGHWNSKWQSLLCPGTQSEVLFL